MAGMGTVPSGGNRFDKLRTGIAASHKLPRLQHAIGKLPAALTITLHLDWGSRGASITLLDIHRSLSRMLAVGKVKFDQEFHCASGADSAARSPLAGKPRRPMAAVAVPGSTR